MLLHSCDSERYLIPSERLYRAKAWWCPRVKCTLRCLPTSLKMAEYMSTSHMKDHFPGVKEDSFIRSERQFLAVLMLAARFECSNGITKSDATEIAAVVASAIQRLTGKSTHGGGESWMKVFGKAFIGVQFFPLYLWRLIVHLEFKTALI